MIALDGLVVADAPESWSAAGFTVENGVCRVGTVGIQLAGRERGTGIVGWALSNLPTPLDDVDGIPVLASCDGAATTHPNGVTSIDHVVVLSPHLERTVNALAEIGTDPRRERDGELGGRPIRQVFYRFGEVIVEVVGSPESTGDGPSSLWGITFVVDDIDTAAAYFGPATTPVKDAVQPGRRITTLRHQEFGMSVRTALISPPTLHT